MNLIYRKKKYEDQLNTLKEKYEKQLNDITKHYEYKLKKKDKKIEKRNLQIKELQETRNLQIKEVQETLQQAVINAVSKPTKTTNNNTISMPILYLGKDRIKEKAEFFGVEHFNEGQKGVARWALKHLLSEDEQILVKCTDPSRGSFTYINEYGNKERDVNASKITKKIYEPITEKTINLYSELNDADTPVEQQQFRMERVDEIKKMKMDNSVFKSELVAMTV